MIYGSLCSGIEAASVAWQPLEWKPRFFSEIENFPSAVLARHYGSNMPKEPWSHNGIPNYGDMTEFERWPDHGVGSEQPISLLVGGTPCQSFSVAGLRRGLDDPRGNLMLTFGAIAKRYQPRWLIWENVTGVLSSRGGRDFGTFLRLLGECGYGFAYRVLDAQYVRMDGYPRAVPQRRRRVFVVGYHRRDWRPAAAVLFEPESLYWPSPPHRKAGQGFAADAASCAAHGGRGLGLAHEMVSNSGDASYCICASGQQSLDAETETLIAFNSRQDMEVTGDRAGPLDSTLPQAQAILTDDWRVRRLTPTECERLQGFPDDYTRIQWRGKTPENCPDGHRYQALGNSMAVNVMRWIGRRIEMVEAVKTKGG